MDKFTTFHLLKHLFYCYLFGIEARFPFVNPLLCLVKKTTQHNVCDHMGWWANSAHHGFNSDESNSWWIGSKIDPYWHL